MALGKAQQPKIPKDELEACVKSSNSWSDVARHFYGNNNWGNLRTIKRYCKYYKLDTAHFKNSRKYKPGSNPNELDTSKIFVTNSPASNTVLAKRYRLLYPAKKCAECGTGTIWNGKPLTLHIDHINGHGTDWRLENCRYLCPNCHYQTETHGTRRGVPKRIDEIKVTPAELSESFDEHGCYITVGAIYGLSDRTVKNIVRKFRRYCNG